MRCIAFDRADKVRDKVVTTLELDINVAPRLLGAVNERDKAVIAEDKPQNEKNNDYDD